MHAGSKLSNVKSIELFIYIPRFVRRIEAQAWKYFKTYFFYVSTGHGSTSDGFKHGIFSCNRCGIFKQFMSI
jgi:hypothetical protein